MIAKKQQPITSDLEELSSDETAASTSGRRTVANTQAEGALPVGVNNSNNYATSDTPMRAESNVGRALCNMQELSLNERSAQLAHRLAATKDLPYFSGNPFEWLHFKEAYESSAELGGYNDRENITRLSAAVRGEAREVVSLLFATTREANAIMRTLELHFGNKRLIANKIIMELRALPPIESGHVSLMQFATKVKNSAEAFKSLKLNAYLAAPEVIESVSSKIPSALRYKYNEYAEKADRE